jgi:TPP-dependent pyruvate/acetoin dehydrogenase alpha subunit
MGINVPVMAGVALAFELKQSRRVALTWVGDGATRTAAFHEGLNLAAVKRLPAIFLIQNNQVALGTRLDAHGAPDMGCWADAYGVRSWTADGNNVLDVYAATRLAADRCRDGDGPALVIVETFRMGGHATHDEREARATFPATLFEEWGRRDPIGLFEVYLETRGIAPDELAEIEATVSEEMDRAAADALASRDNIPSTNMACYDDFSMSSVLAPIKNRLSGSI